ncbi:O-methyltransferase [Polymorphospora sp. NPDC051019]|uniref:O-methyltransferase n=1 Tax=Polymorphospora sp. NPDC051019 TaxID=3155725 RepID=UPI0034367EDE
MKVITIPGVEEYAAAHTTADPDHLLDLAAETRARCERPHMMIGPVEARFLQFFLLTLQPKRVLEVGTFTGYSSLSMIEVLPPDAEITTCEISQEHADIARKHIAAAGYGDRISVRVGPALETVSTLTGPYDFVLLDADQRHFPEYLDLVLPLLSEDGVVVADNVLWSGAVLDPEDNEPATEGIRRFNDTVVARPDLVCVLASVRDGMMFIRRKKATR